jgi:hypothetical protein
MTTFTEEEFALVQRIAGNLPAEKRAAFIEKVAGYMRLHGDYDDDAPDAVELAVDLALRDVTQSAA